MTKMTFDHVKNIFIFPILFDQSIIFCQVEKFFWET